MRPRRFKVTDVGGDTVRLSGREARHALDVLRMKTGDAVALFDGQGNSADGVIVAIDSEGLVIAVRSRQAAGTGPVLILAVATPKGERADWMIEKCAELGVDRFIPLTTERGEVSPGQGKLGRWARKAVEASKQSGQSRVMVIEEPQVLEAVLAETGTVLFGQPHTASCDLFRALNDARDAPALIVLVGPEGGFTDTEIRRIESAGGRPVRLAGTTLRVETAAVAAASLWAAWKTKWE